MAILDAIRQGAAGKAGGLCRVSADAKHSEHKAMITSQWTEDPVCPHCGYVDESWSEYSPPKEDGDSWVAACPECGETYTVKMGIIATFITKATV